MVSGLNKEDFALLLDTYGADPIRWPEHLRTDAARLAGLYPELMREAHFLDRTLDSYAVEPLESDFLEQVMRNAAQPARRDTLLVIFRRPWHKAAMLAACAVLGFWFGAVSMQVMPSYTAQDAHGAEEAPVDPAQLSEAML